jgi:hypothetical protein
MKMQLQGEAQGMFKSELETRENKTKFSQYGFGMDENFVGSYHITGMY